MFIPFDRIHECNRQTDGQTDTARRQQATLMHSIAEQYRSKDTLFVQVRGPRRNTAMRFGTEKLEWWSTRELQKLLVSIEYTNVTDTHDGQTDGETPHDGIGRARLCLTSCGNHLNRT